MLEVVHSFEALPGLRHRWLPDEILSEVVRFYVRGYQMICRELKQDIRIRKLVKGVHKSIPSSIRGARSEMARWEADFVHSTEVKKSGTQLMSTKYECS